MATRRKPSQERTSGAAVTISKTQSTKPRSLKGYGILKAEQYAWPFEDTVYSKSDDFLKEHWLKIVADCLDTCYVFDIPYHMCVGSDRSRDHFLIDIHGSDETLPLALSDNSAALRGDTLDVVNTFSDMVIERKKAEAKRERRKKAIESLTPEQREALDL